MYRFKVFFMLLTTVTGIALMLVNSTVLHSGNVASFFMFYILSILSSIVIALSVDGKNINN